jgi:hypothetical protein
MSSLRFGADSVVGTVTIPVDENIFKAGRKGTLNCWYPLTGSDEDEEMQAGEVSCSFCFKQLSPPSPVRTKPIVVNRPWWATAAGLYAGTKDVWGRALETDRYYISPVAAFIDRKVADVVQKRSKTRVEVDCWVQEKLHTFDESVDTVIPKVWAKVPLKHQLNVDIPLTCSHDGVPKTLFPTEEEPERVTVVVDDDYFSPNGKAEKAEMKEKKAKKSKRSKKDKSGQKMLFTGSFVSGYPSMLPSSAMTFKERTESYSAAPESTA